MPPPMPNPSKRITANPVRPARYRPGKAVPEDESSEEEDEEEVEEPKKPVAKPQPRAQPQRSRQSKQDEEEDDDEEGFVTDEEDELPAAVQAKIPAPSRTTTTTQHTVQAQVSQPQTVTKIESQDEESEEEESSEGESSSEEEAPQRKFQRPTFIKKADRRKAQDPTEVAAQPSITAATSTLEVDEQTRRLAQADLYIKDKLERDALARAQGKKAWDDDEELDPEAQVDDTDGVDPVAEYAAWKLRELKRLKRDREAIEAREKEIEEIERRRNLTKEERHAEDREYLEKQKEDRDQGRGKAGFLAKYHHKGAFFQDDEAVEVLKKRDLVGARFEDDVDKSALPEYMRIRDMTKLGKKGRTRYTDLRNEDTGRFGENVKRWKGSGYETRDGQDGGANSDLRGVDERFLPDRDGDRDRDRDARGPTGANTSVVGQRRERRYSGRSRSRSRSRSPRRREDTRGDTYRPRRRSYSYSRSRSRSRTPPRRKRSPSPYRERDKRRRIGVD